MGVVGTGDMVITILEDCGTSLDKLLPLKYKKLAVNLADLAQAIYVLMVCSQVMMYLKSILIF